MKITFKRILALALCAAMLFGMLPMQQVKAEDMFIGGFVANNTAELVEALTEAERLVAPEKVVTIQIGEPFELTENVSVPGGCRLDVPVPFTIGAGVTMAVFGNLEVTAEMTNKGILANNGNVTVYGNAGGSLAFAPTGKYTGSGEMMVINPTYEDILPGLDLTNFNVEQGQGIGGVRWIITANENVDLGPDEYGNYHFSNMEELKLLAQNTYNSWTNVQYTGGSPLVIDESITINGFFIMNAHGCEVRIAEGVTAEIYMVNADVLTVDGTLEVNDVNVYGQMDIAGSVILNGYIFPADGVVITGMDKIQYMDNTCKIRRFYEIQTMEDLHRAIAVANAVTDSHEEVYLDFRTENFVIDESVTLPERSSLQVNQPLTIAEDVKLTVNCEYGHLWKSVTVKGELENNGWFAVHYPDSVLTFEEGAVYSGTGVMIIHGITEGDPMVAIPGLDTTGYVLMDWGDGYTWQITPEGYNPGGGDSGMTTFSSFEELKELATQTWDDWTWIYYRGEDTLEITEDIVMPENLNIDLGSQGMYVAEGVNARFDNVDCYWMLVDGDMHVVHTNVSEYLTVTGSLTVEESIYISSRANLEGRDKIAFANGWAGIYREFYNVDLGEFKERIVEAEENAHADSRMHYVLYLVEEPLVLEESLTVPSMVNVYFQGPLTVAAGATLTLNSENVYLWAPATVNGTLVNNSWLMVSAYSGGTMTFAEGSTYTGSGTLAVEKEPSVPLESVLPGLDLSSLYLRQDGDFWWYVSTTNNNGGGGGNMQTFNSFEELKELASQSWDDWTWVEYSGGGVLEITENIVMPENLQVQTSGGVRIAEGVNARFNYLTCGWLEVNGDLHVVHTNGSEYLTVTGSLTVEESIYISSRANLEGRDKIAFANGWAGIYREFYDVDLDEFKERIVEAEENAHADSRMHYVLYLVEEPLVLEESLTVPSMVNVYFEGPLTVAAGATLTLNSENVQLYAPATVYGALENNSWLYVGAYNNATLTFAEDSTYTGNGAIAVEKDPAVSLESVLPGLDLSQWEIQQDGDYWWYIYPIGGGGGNGLTFSTMEELQALAAESYDWGYMVYAGTGDFVISEDITMPTNTYVDFGTHNVVVSEGVTANFFQMTCNDLTVHGTLNTEYQGAMGNVAVYGTLKTSQIQIGETTTITGLENIKFTNSYDPLSRVYFVDNGEELVTALNKAANPQLPKETAIIQLDGGPVILTEDATLPKKCELYISDDMIIAENATLTINGMVSIGCPMTVKGTLVNNYDIYTWDGRMIIAEGGKYEGRGALRVIGGNDYNTVFQGLNLEDFQITNDYGEWRLVYVAGLAPVAAPSELEWGYTYDDGVKVALPGAVSWKSGITDTTGVEYVCFYRINEDGSETLVNQYDGIGYDKRAADGYNSTYTLLLSSIPSGRYYFTVCSQGNYENTKNSETVRSDIWEYTKPSDRLDTATNLGWSDDSFRAEWTNPNDPGEVYYAMVNWYYKSQENGYEYYFAQIPAGDVDYAELDEYLIAAIGLGYYRYEIMFISADITKTGSSVVSEKSEWYHLEKMPETPVTQLGGLLADPDKTDAEKLEEVQNIGADTLKEVLEENGDALNIVSQLEDSVAGGAAEVEVTDETVELAAEQISIIGANLNSKENEDKQIKLVIDKVEEVRDITGNYETSTAVQFSMTLENVKDSKNLEVPVVVTLPVPEGMDPEKIVILHYHDDGTYDVITPEVSISGGKTYAQFVLTSFSDFAILEKLAALLGDIDFNDSVDVDDVLALLWYVLFPDMYPIDVEADFDGSGSVDVDDVLALLWNVLFPDMYPLG